LRGPFKMSPLPSCSRTAATAAVFAIALTTFLSTSVDAAHKCFVCKPSHADGTYATEISELHKHWGRNVKRCEDYTRERKSEFIMECPKEKDVGCLTVFQDGSVMRTCAKVGLKDCIEMEGKTYCYCKNQLCNTPDGPLASFGGNAHHRKDYSDDEGSGYGDDDDDEDYYNYGEEDITEMPPSVKMDEGVEVRDEVEQPRKSDESDIFIVEENEDDERSSGAASVAHASIALFIALVLAVGT